MISSTAEISMADRLSSSSSSRRGRKKGKGSAVSVAVADIDVAAAAQQLVQLSDEENNNSNRKESSISDQGEVVMSINKAISPEEITNGEVSSSVKISMEAIFGKEEDEEEVDEEEEETYYMPRKRRYRAVIDIYSVTKPVKYSDRYLKKLTIGY